MFVQRERFPVRKQAQWKDGCKCDIRGIFEISEELQGNSLTCDESLGTPVGHYWPPHLTLVSVGTVSFPVGVIFRGL